MPRTELTIPSGEATLAAWLYTPEHADGDLPCVVMAHGFSLTRHDGLPLFAQAFADAGAAVLVFDHRYLGDSGGEPRQRIRLGLQQIDWRNAIAHARTLPGIDVNRIALWGFSMSGGHIAKLGAEDRRLAALMLLCPFLDGVARVLSTPPKAVAQILPKAFADLAGKTNYIPVTAAPGALGAMTLAGESDGFHRAVPAGSPWRNEATPGLFATVALHRPVTRAAKLAMPVWVGLGERDISVSNKSVERLATRAPRGELQRYPEYDHFDPFVDDAPARIVADQIAFLRRVNVLTS